MEKRTRYQGVKDFEKDILVPNVTDGMASHPSTANYPNLRETISEVVKNNLYVFPNLFSIA
jgi:hypothetical protein